MYDKKIICLANSFKPPSGRCLAGKEILPGAFGGWVRPVSDRPTREVSEEERRYPSGQRAGILDVFTVRMLRAEPIDHQVENHVLDESRYFVLEGRANWQHVQGCLDAYDPRFWGPAQSTQHGAYFGERDRSFRPS